MVNIILLFKNNESI